MLKSRYFQPRFQEQMICNTTFTTTPRIRFLKHRPAETYRLLGFSFIPAAAGAALAANAGFNFYAAFGSRWIGFAVVLAFFYGMIHFIEKIVTAILALPC